tara:strand:+ start:5514 stop:5885 length:372 start_codon:yes stop_codon:yes gene_type:complete
MKKLLLTAPLLALGLLATPALANTGAQPAVAEQPEARINFVNHGGIRNWHAEDRDTLYIQDRRRNWYKAELMIPSPELPFALAIGFDTGPIGSLDRFSQVVVDGRSFPLASLVKVDGPPEADG